MNCRSPLNFKASCLTDRGQVREENQDACYADIENGLFIVSDGMGGEACGAIASQAVVSVLPKVLERHLASLGEETEEAISEALRDSIAEFSGMLYNRTKGEPQLQGMGATVALALVQGKDVYIAHIGDSRAHLFSEGSLKQLTRDHSIVAVMLELGQITLEQARSHPARSRLSRYIGMSGRAVADVQKVTVMSGDRLLLCSDGLSNMLSDEEIANILAWAGNAELACRTLVEGATSAGGHDNITVILIDFK